MIRSLRPFVAITLLLSLVLAACGGDDPSKAAPPEPAVEAEQVVEPDTDREAELVAAWDATLDEIQDDGSISLDTALAGFSLLVAPLPGVDVEPNEADVPVGDASNVVAWVLRHFDELTDDQRAAVAEALSPPSGTVAVGGRGRSRGQAAPGVGCFGQTIPTGDSDGSVSYRARLDDLATEITSKLGGAIRLSAPVHLVLDTREQGLGLAYTWGDPGGDCTQNGLATCVIHLSPRAQAKSAVEVEGILAHELMHCFVFQHLGMTTYELPDWVGEGIPAWVGESIAGGSATSTSWWTRYLTRPDHSLYARSYDAIGFYSHLDEVGIDPWSRIVAMLDGYENEPAFEAAGASSASFLESWPSSMLRRTDHGRAWDADGPGITIDRATPEALEVGEGTATEEVGKVRGRLFALDVSADVVTIEVDGTARLWNDGDDDVITSASFCARDGGCECPDGSSAGPRESLGDDAVLAVTGGTDTAVVTLVGRSIECDDDEPATAAATPDAVDRCLVGSWVSTYVAIEDEVTGMPGGALGGGEGIVLDIRRDGSFRMDFDESTPVMADVAGMRFGHQTTGVAAGRLRANRGDLEVIESDAATALSTRFVGMRGGGGSAGGTAIGDGTYDCDDDELELRASFELGETVFRFDKE